MPDNDKMMNLFIEKATPRLLEAMQDALTQQVEKQIGGLRDHATRLLDEVKDTKRASSEKDDMLAETQKLLEALGNADIKKQAESAGLDFSKPKPLQISREQARDPRTYRAAKAQADEQGTTLEILSND